MKTIIAMTIATIAVFVIGLGLRLGVHKSVQVTQLEEGPFKQVFMKHVGPYHKIVPVMDKVEDWGEDNAETCDLSFGEYLDDPNIVDEDRLQSYGGCIVKKDWSRGPLPPGFQYREVPRKQYVVAMFNGAPSISPYKVYPKALEYMKANNMKLAGPVMEIYRVLVDMSVETKYLFPITPNVASAP